MANDMRVRDMDSPTLIDRLQTIARGIRAAGMRTADTVDPEAAEILDVLKGRCTIRGHRAVSDWVNG